jgi:glycosyltransferase involved in cell wall biosynthesis
VTDASTPLVSIVIPVRNGERFVGEALRSALGQTATDLEVVVADNASTDGTLDVVRALGDGRLRVLTSPVDVGAGANWNRAVRAATGTYVKLLCADDVLEPRCLERQLAGFAGAAGDGVALVCARRRVVDDRGRAMLERGFRPRLRGRVGRFTATRRVARSGGNPIGEPAAVLFRRDDALKAGIFREDAGYVIDLDFWLRLLLRGDLFVVDEILASFRVSSGSWSVSLARRQAAQYCELLRRVATDGSLELRLSDVVIGCGAAELMATARRLLYAWLARRARRDAG